VLLSAWLLKKRIGRRHVLALALSYGGIALVFTENLNFGAHAHETALGGALVFASGVIYAFYRIGAGEIVGKIGAMRFTAYAMLVACAVCIAQFLLTHEVRTLVLPAQVYWLTLSMAIVSTVIPAWLMAEGIRLSGANHAAMVGSVGPVAPFKSPARCWCSRESCWSAHAPHDSASNPRLAAFRSASTPTASPHRSRRCRRRGDPSSCSAPTLHARRTQA
jgi:hypothetical protein